MHPYNFVNLPKKEKEWMNEDGGKTLWNLFLLSSVGEGV